MVCLVVVSTCMVILLLLLPWRNVYSEIKRTVMIIYSYNRAHISTTEHTYDSHTATIWHIYKPEPYNYVYIWSICYIDFDWDNKIGDRMPL